MRERPITFNPHHEQTSLRGFQPDMPEPACSGIEGIETIENRDLKLPIQKLEAEEEIRCVLDDI